MPDITPSASLVYLGFLLCLLPMLLWYGVHWQINRSKSISENESVSSVPAGLSPAWIRYVWKGFVDPDLLLLVVRQAVQKGVYELNWAPVNPGFRIRLKNHRQFGELSPEAKRVLLGGGNIPLPEVAFLRLREVSHHKMIERLETYFESEGRSFLKRPTMVIAIGFFWQVICMVGIVALLAPIPSFGKLFYLFGILFSSFGMLILTDRWLNQQAGILKWLYLFPLLLFGSINLLLDHFSGLWIFTPAMLMTFFHLFLYLKLPPYTSKGRKLRAEIDGFKAYLSDVVTPDPGLELYYQALDLPHLHRDQLQNALSEPVQRAARDGWGYTHPRREGRW
jgi:hypothetical protein